MAETSNRPGGPSCARTMALAMVLAVAAFSVAAQESSAQDLSEEPAMRERTAGEPLRFERLTTDPIAHGERLAAVLGCIGCHGLDLTGSDWSDPELGVLWTANLTQSAASFSEQELTAMIVEGRRPDRSLMDMPSVLFTQLHPDDVTALVAYLKTLEPRGEVHPEPTIGPQLARDIESGTFRDSAQQVQALGASWPPDLGPEHAFGRHILRATCTECHGMDLTGDDADIAGAPARPDLRIVAAYPEADFYTFLETGKALGGRELELMTGVARWRYSRFMEREARAVHEYLLAFAGKDEAPPPRP